MCNKEVFKELILCIFKKYRPIRNKNACANEHPFMLKDFRVLLWKFQDLGTCFYDTKVEQTGKIIKFNAVSVK